MSNTDISPAAPNSPGTQIAVTGPSGTVTPSSRPFILYTGTDLTGTATGDPEVRVTARFRTRKLPDIG